MSGKKKYIRPEIEETVGANETEAAAFEANVTKEAAQTKAESTFTKVQLISAKRFSGRRDLLNILLDESKEYTVKAVEEMIEKYMKGKVV